MIINENTCNAEILWTLEVVQSHLSFRICISISKLFAVIFPKSEISLNFVQVKLNVHSLRTMIAPHFKRILLTSFNNSSFYCVAFHESLCCKVVKWMLIFVFEMKHNVTYDSKFAHRQGVQQTLKNLNSIKFELNGLKNIENYPEEILIQCKFPNLFLIFKLMFRCQNNSCEIRNIWLRKQNSQVLDFSKCFKVLSATFFPVCFVNLKKSTCETKKKFFISP